MVCDSESKTSMIHRCDNLTSHLCVAKIQAKCLKQRKEELDDDCVLVLGVFKTIAS